MPNVAYQVSVSTGACGHPPCTPSAWSDNVFANNQAVLRLGDEWNAHPDGFHPGHVIASASPTVFANGRNLARIGDSLSCGDTIGTGSSNVISG